jgi:hypothetical protein
VGVYGEKTGSWYIHPSYEYQPGDQLSQTLTVSSDVLLSRLRGVNTPSTTNNETLLATSVCVTEVPKQSALTVLGASGVIERRRSATQRCAGYFALQDWKSCSSARGQNMGAVALVSCKTIPIVIGQRSF